MLAGLRDDLIAAVTALVPDVVLSGDPGQSLVDGGAVPAARQRPPAIPRL